MVKFVVCGLHVQSVAPSSSWGSSMCIAWVSMTMALQHRRRVGVELEWWGDELEAQS